MLKERYNDNMDIETEKIFLNQVIAQKKELFSAEDNVIIPDIKPDILSVINTSANIYVYKKELINGRVKIDGGIQIEIIYIADNENNNIRGLHTVLDFSKYVDIDNLDESCNLICNLNVKSIDPKILNGRKLNIKADFEADIKIYSNQEKELVKSINNMERLQMISETVKVNSLKGRGETVCSAKDTISVDDNLADILGCDICIKNKDKKVSYNKVLTKADSIIELLYLTEDEQIKTVAAKIPIMGFIDISGISDNDIFDINYEIKNINIKPNDVADHSVYVEIEFFIMCQAYEEKEINLIQDLYSPEEEIIMNQENVSLMQDKKSIFDNCELNEKISMNDIKDNKIYNLKACPNIVKQNITDNEILYECELIVYILYESSITGKIEEKMQKIEFTHNVNCDNIGENTALNTSIEIDSKNFVISAESSVDVTVNLNFILDVYNKKSLKLVNDIKFEQDSSNKKCSSLVIYFVKDGDTLWKIAKKFKSTIDDIAKINGIENVDKLHVGDQLFIPRYVNNKVS